MSIVISLSLSLSLSLSISFIALSITAEGLTIDRIIELKKSLLRAFGEAKRVSPSHLLLKLAKQPVSSLRNASMHLMRAIASQPTGWGLHVLFNYTGNLNNPLLLNREYWIYLKDRTTEYEKEGKLYKYAIIECIGKSLGRELLHEDMIKLLDVMIKEGPYYMPPKLAEMETM